MTDAPKLDTGHAVQVAAKLDDLLLKLILTHLDREHIPRSLIDKSLDTFAKKRRTARERGLIDNATDADLKLVNDVRVVFAHAETPITFRNHHITDKLNLELGADVRRLFDEAATRAERAIEERRNRLLYDGATR